MGGFIRVCVLAVAVIACLADAAPVQQQAQPAGPAGGGAPPPQPAADCRTQCRNLMSCGAIASREYNTCVDACHANDQGYMSARRDSCKR